MKILGIDPGSRFTGYGIIEVSGDCATLVCQGVIKTGGGAFPERLGIIFNVDSLVRIYLPSIMAATY